LDLHEVAADLAPTEPPVEIDAREQRVGGEQALLVRELALSRRAVSRPGPGGDQPTAGSGGAGMTTAANTEERHPRSRLAIGARSRRHACTTALPSGRKRRCGAWCGFLRCREATATLTGRQVE
jgi:hypothetical protein